MVKIENTNFRFFLINDLDRREVDLLGTVAVTWELQDESFYYQKVVGSFTLGNSDGDFTWVKAIESTGDLCKELLIEIEQKCDNGWELYARSKWTIQSCSFENAKCIVKVNPDATGLGSCLNDLATADYNILQLMIDATGFKYDSITFMSDAIGADLLGYGNGHMFYYGGATFAPLMIRPQFVDNAGDPALSGTPTLEPTPTEMFTAGLIPENEIDHIKIERIGIFQDGILSPPYVVYVAWAYRRAEFKIAGNNPPTPNGYSIINDSGDPVIYQKKPTDEDRSITGVAVLGSSWGDCDDVGVIPSSSDTVYNGVLIGETGIPVNGLCLYVTHKDVHQYSTLKLESLLQRFIDQCDEDKIPISDFFQINPENVSTINYVTGLPSLTSDIRFVQRGDQIFFYIQNATVGLMKFADLDQILRNSFQVYWTEDFDGNLRLEHYSYYENIVIGLDVTTGKQEKFTKNELSYDYKRELLPFIEQVSDDGNHHNYNWDLREIRYVNPDGTKLPCVGTDSLERSYGVFNTDFEYFIEYPTLIPRDGWVMVAVQLGIGFSDEIIAEDSLPNGTLSIRRLVERYYNNGRSALIAKITSSILTYDTTFDTTIRLKTEDGLAFPLCCDDDFDPRKNIKTPNGIGRVISAEHDLKTKKLTTNNEY